MHHCGPDAGLHAVLATAASVAGVATASVDLFDGSAGHWSLTCCSGTVSPLFTALPDAVEQAGDGVLDVPDARLDPRFAADPWVDGRLGETVFCAAVAVRSSSGHLVGVLSVSAEEPVHLSAHQRARLADLAVVTRELVDVRRRARFEQSLAAAVTEAQDLVELAHEELGVRHELLEGVLETVDVGIAAVDALGRPTLVNQTLRTWYGMAGDDEPGRVAGAAAGTLLAGDGRTPLPAERLPLLRALTEGSVADTELVLAAPGRPVRAVVARARALRSPSGELLGAVMALTDVTAERAAREELQRSNRELEHFAAVAGHDLRSPLTTVGGYVELLEDVYGDRLDDLARSWLSTVHGSVTRMTALIDALLGYARTGAQVLAPEPVDLGAVLDLVLVDLRTGIEQTGARVGATGPLPVVEADAVQLRQLLQNLVANALVHSRPGHPPTVRCSAEPSPDGWVVAVADDGVGIPADRREAVFRMFERAGDRPQTAGTGIGLATAHRIVTRHGGRIWVDETPGGGATVRFTLPQSASALVVLPDAASTVNAVSTVDAAHAGA